MKYGFGLSISLFKAVKSRFRFGGRSPVLDGNPMFQKHWKHQDFEANDLISTDGAGFSSGLKKVTRHRMNPDTLAISDPKENGSEGTRPKQNNSQIEVVFNSRFVRNPWNR